MYINNQDNMTIFIKHFSFHFDEVGIADGKIGPMSHPQYIVNEKLSYT